MSETECPICCDLYTKTKRHPVECPKCEHTCCSECMKTYISGQTSSPHCMKCENEFERDFIHGHLGVTFMKTTYRAIKKELLFEIEKSRFPETMPRAVAWTKAQELKKEKQMLVEERERLRRLLFEQEQAIFQMDNRIYSLENGVIDKKEKKQFIQPCVVEDCNGYLSSQWKCELCKNHVCPKCHVVMGEKKDEYHVCDPQLVETISAIKKETKPCPKCHAPIFKISGCDQMWCTQCEVAFSWKTGDIQRGHIHNPHYYEAQRRTGMIVRNPGDVVCGGLVNFRDIHPIISSMGFSFYRKPQELNDAILFYLFKTLHRGVSHSQYILDNLRTSIRQLANTENLRIQFLTKQRDKVGFKRAIFQNSEKNIKQRKLCDIFELYMNVVTENINETFTILQNNKTHFRDIPPDTIQAIVVCLERIDKIIQYSEEEFLKVAKEYRQATYVFSYSTLEINYSKPGKSVLSGESRWLGWRNYIEKNLLT